MKGDKNLIRELERAKNDLELAVNNPNSTIEELTKIAKNIDELIRINYIVSDTNSEIEQKYKSIIQNEDNRKIIEQIKSDLLDIHRDISLLELEMLSNNIYDFCCLTVYEIPQEEIGQYILFRNQCYFNKLSDNDLELMVKNKIETIEALTKKYIKILKSNKQSNK